VDTKAVDVDCSQLDSASDLYLQCLVGESAKKNLQVTITTQTFTSSSTDIDIDWSEYPGALTYRLSLTEDKSCQKQISTFESSANAKRVSVTKDATYHICVFANLPDGSAIAATNNGVPFTIDTTKPVLESTTTPMPAKITDSFTFEAKVQDEEGVTYKWVHKSGDGTVNFSNPDSGTTTITYEAGGGGPQEVDLIITDQAGNNTIITYNFDTDPVANDSGTTPSSGNNTNPSNEPAGNSTDITAPLAGDSGNLNTANILETSLSLSWTKANDADSNDNTIQYEVRQSLANNMNSLADTETNGSIIQSYETDNNSYAVTELAAATTYYFNVIARDAAGNKSIYTSVAATTLADNTLPIVGNSGTINTASIAETGLTLSWTKATDDHSLDNTLQYEVRQSLANNMNSLADTEANGSIIQSYEADDSSHTVTGLTTNTTYYFNVIAKDASGNQSIYTTVAATTLADSTAPDAGDSGTINTASITENGLTLSWTTSTDLHSPDNTIQYQVRQSSADNMNSLADTETNGSIIQDYETDDNSYTVTALTAGSVYYFNVIARNAAGNKSIYTTVAATTLADSTAPEAGDSGTINTASIAETGLTLSWTKANDVHSPNNTIQYEVRQSLANNMNSLADTETNGSIIQSYETDNNSYAVTELAAATTYYFNVIARDAAGNKSIYTSIAATTLADNTLPIVGNSGTINTASIAETGLTLSWTKATDDHSLDNTLQYEVRQSLANNMNSLADTETNGSIIQSYEADDSNHIVTGLTTNTTYYFNVIAKDASGNQSIYTTVAATTLADSTAPDAGDSGIINTASISDMSVSLTWTKATDTHSPNNTIQYQVRQSSTNNMNSLADTETNGSIIQDYETDDSSYTATALAASTTYYFNVIARDATGNKSIYTTVSATTAVDSTPPNVLTVSSSSSDGNYQGGEQILITITFSEIVNVTGTPTIELETGINDGVATYISGSGTDTLVFSYTPAFNHSVSGLNYQSTNSLVLGSATISDATGNSAALTLPETTSPSSLAGSSSIEITPTTVTITINSGDASTNNSTLNLEFNAYGAAEMLISETAECSSGSWETYTNTKNWALSSLNTSVDVSVKFRDSSNNETACIAGSIIHDNIAPNATYANEPSNPTNNISYDFDVLPANGLVSYTFAVINAAADCASAGYSANTNETTNISSNLTASGSWKLCLKGIDELGNEQSTATEYTWTLAPTPNPTDLAADDGSGPNENSTSTTLSWVTGGESTTGFKISYGPGDTPPPDCSSGTVIDEVSITGTSHSLTNLTASDQYSFRVCALNDLGEESTGSTLTVDFASLDLEVTTLSSNETFEIGLDEPDGLTIHWGDTSVSSHSATGEDNQVTHIYQNPGVYTVKIRGKAARINFYSDNAANKLTKLLSVVSGISDITSFRNAFKDTALSETIPDNFFDNTTMASDFSHSFAGTSSLSGPIPSGLFDQNTAATTFESTFAGSGITSIPSGLFDNNNLATSFVSAFENTNLAGGNAPALWDDFPSADGTNCFQSSSVDNIASIPETWGGDLPLYRFYRLLITRNNAMGLSTGDVLIINELGFKINGVLAQNLMTDNNIGTIGGINAIASASSQGEYMDYSTFTLITLYAYQAFDGEASSPNFWQSLSAYDMMNGYYTTASPSWIQIEFPFEINVTGLRLEAPGSDRAPRDFKLQGSDDEINWTDIPGSELTEIDISDFAGGYEYDF